MSLKNFREVFLLIRMSDEHFVSIYLLLLEMLVLPHWYAKQSESLIQHSLLQEPRSQGDGAVPKYKLFLE